MYIANTASPTMSQAERQAMTNDSEMSLRSLSRSGQEHSGDMFFTKDVDAGQESMGVMLFGAEITSIFPGGWAEENGIELDDEIIAVNGVEFGGLSSEDREALFFQRPLEVEFCRPVVKDEYFSVNCDQEGELGFRLAGVHVHSLDGLEEASPRVSPEISGDTTQCWAARVGLRVHDEILSLNGKSLEGLSEARRRELLETMPRPLSIRVKRYHPLHLRKFGRMSQAERQAVSASAKDLNERHPGDVFFTKHLTTLSLGLGFFGVEITSILPGGCGKKVIRNEIPWGFWGRGKYL